MRDILFRGKTYDGEWVEGFLFNSQLCRIFWATAFKKEEDNIFYCEGKDVNPETVGQFTGLTDKNGKKIFEGDIVRLCNGTYPIKVFWDCLGWKFLRNGKRVQGAFECDIKHDIEICEVIGNIHDNKNLLGE